MSVGLTHGASNAPSADLELDHSQAPSGLLVNAVHKHWGKATILDGVDLTLEPGTTTWISGGNGVGKTTLMRIVAGLIMPDRGTVSFNGARSDADRRTFQSQVGFLAAGDSGLYARLSVYSNLEFWAGLAFVPRSQRRATIERALCGFTLTELASRRVDRLSLGQRQRVRLAMTFLHNPRLLLLDEPSSSLDDEGVAGLLKAVAEHADTGSTVLWCAPTRHDELDCDRAYVLSSGRLRPA